MKKNAVPSIGHVLLASALLFGAGAGALCAAPRDAFADGACGTKDEPCPLQKWMRANMAPALAAGDAPALAAAFDKAAGFAPDPSWNGPDAKKGNPGWDAIAKAGAAAARANDLSAAKAACKSCHDAFKEPYKSKFRAKPL